MRAPDFWQNGGPAADILLPLSWAYAAATALRRGTARPWRPSVPVVCIGNLVAGGAGKTPTALAVAQILQAEGLRPHFLTRGYRGCNAGPLRVDRGRHTAREVGDEALLLATAAPTWVARNRTLGALAACVEEAEAIVMDDGFQNPTLVKDVSLVAIDGAYGFGNGRLMPAGPLRERVTGGLERASAVVLIGSDDTGVTETIGSRVPLVQGRLAPGPEAVLFAGKDVLAFAGIGRPKKFFATLEEIGARLVDCRAFPDHHPFTEKEMHEICADADASGAVPVTTEKDAVRLPADMQSRVRVLSVSLEWDDPAEMLALLRPVFTRD